MRALLHLKKSLETVLAEMNVSYHEKTVIEPPKDSKHGDLAINIAMLLAKELGQPPRKIAEDIAQRLQKDTCIEKCEVAGPGFLNVYFNKSFWQETIIETETKKEKFGAGANKDYKILIEYVSANPTGPLHIGHGRGAAVGDSLRRILDFAGYDVDTEYYINDAGRQMRLLGLSIWLRLKEVAEKEVVLPEDFYRGEYIIDLAKELWKKEPNIFDLPEDEAENLCFEYGMNSIMDGIKQDLADFRVGHDFYYSEKSLVEKGAVEASFERLREMGYLYEQEGALWFKSTELGDDKDRVLKKSDGSLTYFASDIAYHDDKYNRGYNKLIDIWGYDHHGYVPRMKSAITALNRKKEDFDVILIQLVNLLRAGELVAMSTRAGVFDTLADVVKEVGVDASRFMFLSRKSDSHLDFDLELVKERNMNNPVYYVQYAYARTRSMLRRASEQAIEIPNSSDLDMLSSLNEDLDIAILRKLDQFEDVAEQAARLFAPQAISTYLTELSGLLHSYYNKYPVLQAEDKSIVLARLMLMRAVGQVIVNGLSLLGVEAPESM